MPEVRVAPEPTTPRRVVEDVFLTVVLPLLLQAEGYEALHASAVRMPGGVIACCGFSGSGKTTVAYGLARRGHALWADDAVLFRPPGDTLTVWSSVRLPHTYNLRPAAKQFFGMDHDDEVVVDAPPADEDRLGAVVVLRREPGASVEIARLPLAAAVTAVIPHAYCFFAEQGRDRKTAAAYLDLASRTPVFQVRLPDGFTGFETALDELEARFSETIADA